MTTPAEAMIVSDRNMFVAGRRGARFLRDLDFSVERQTALLDHARSGYDAEDEAKRTNTDTAISAP
ncbi:hypothetical protein [Sphingomonas sp. LaA6.9]|uniref:hypothetical protein n=1 Tax=Sphingomonas sp. LaA6.9 TaxID=2919914 RepID=UPI001F4F38E3|nr:hypothetical protein [Sphingomonas sp. LaA6.9]MCJ8159463.1 hypothetical protein [Sphingomonas sp. LaA6.9]